MIPVKSHFDAVKMSRYKRVQKTVIQELDSMVHFDPRFVAAVARSEMPYELAANSNVYRHEKLPLPQLSSPRKQTAHRIGYEPTHHCGSAVPLPKENVLTSADVVKHWQQYYTKMKAKRENVKKFPGIANAAMNKENAQKFRDAEPFDELKWDEYALSLVGRNMQEFIVFRLTSKSAGNYQRLSRNYIKKFGRPKKELEKIELIDDLFDGDDRIMSGQKKPTWLKKELVRLLPESSGITKYEMKQHPDGRVSAVIDFKPKTDQKVRKESQGCIITLPRLVKSTSAINLATQPSEVVVVPRARSATPPPKFSKELVSGSKQLYSGRESGHVTFSTGRRFKKKLQRIYPVADSRAEEESGDDGNKSVPHSRAPSRGLRRWLGEPEFLQKETELVNRPYEPSDNEGSVLLSSRQSTAASSADINENRREGTQSRLEKLETAEMRAKMASEWRNKWRINLSDTSDPNDLFELLTDLHPINRIRGIMTICYIAHGKHSSNAVIPKYLIKCVERIVAEDTDADVQKAAAVCLSSLNFFTKVPAVRKVLVDIIRSENSDSVDKWTAAQGLAHNQVYTSDVISIFLQIYVDNYSPDGADDPRRSVALQLIQIVSSGTALAAGMAGELLANADWKVRQSACEILGACHGPLPADVVSKLSQVMWTDWSEHARVAAARTLGQTGHGLDVHHELLARLQSKSGAERARALRLIAVVGFMTVRIMPLFLDCFHDTYTDVREAACSVACRLYKLSIRSKTLLDSSIAERLIEIMHYDTSGAVRVTAIQAIENCLMALHIAEPQQSQSAAVSASLFRAEPTANQLLREKIFACLVWSLQTATEVKVRLQALQILKKNNYGDAEYADILRQRLLAEQAEEVRKELEQSLEECLRQLQSATRAVPLLGDLRKNIRELASSRTGIVALMDKHDKMARLREFRSNHLVTEKRTKKRNNGKDTV